MPPIRIFAGLSKLMHPFSSNVLKPVLAHLELAGPVLGRHPSDKHKRERRPLFRQGPLWVGWGGYFLQESETIAMSVATRWPCSFASESMASFAFSFAPCMSGCFTRPEMVTVCPMCPASFTVLD